MKTKLTQNQKILAYLKSGKKLNPLQALRKFGCFRLSARIHDMKYNPQLPIIKSELVTRQGKVFSEYSI